MSRPLPAVSSLLPHRGTILLVTEILEHNVGGLACLGSISSDSPFARNGEVPCFLGLEAAAQAGGLHAALLARSSGGRDPVHGYLVSVHEGRFRSSTLPTDTKFEVSVKLDGVSTPLRIYRYELRCKGATLSEGKFGLYAETEP